MRPQRRANFSGISYIQLTTFPRHPCESEVFWLSSLSKLKLLNSRNSLPTAFARAQFLFQVIFLEKLKARAQFMQKGKKARTRLNIECETRLIPSSEHCEWETDVEYFTFGQWGVMQVMRIICLMSGPHCLEEKKTYWHLEELLEFVKWIHSFIHSIWISTCFNLF